MPRSGCAAASAARYAATAFLGTVLTAYPIANSRAQAADTADIEAGLSDFQQGRFAEALQDWSKAAAAGDARGYLYIGVLYDTGLGVPQDYRQAMDWYRKAASAGSAPGAFNVGILYDSGLGVAKSPDQAAAWYAQAAAARFGRAEYNLAMLYDAGIGVPRSHARAIALYKDAAEDGIVAARSHLPAAGQSTRGPRPKPTPPKPMPQDKALQDFQEAQKLILSRGSAELSRAASLFRKAAEQHNALAEYDLGYSYDRGLGVSKDPGQAAAWYRRAAADTTDTTLRQLAHTGAAALDGKPGK